MPTTVTLTSCAAYDDAAVRAAVRQALEGLPGLGDRLCSGLRVMLKPNVVNPRGPERPICTHPRILRAVAELCREAGAEVLVCDQPTYALSGQDREVFAAAGYLEALAGLPVEWGLASAKGYRARPVPRPYRVREAQLTRWLDEVDFVVNLPRLKTHMQTLLTGAVKNMFGLVAPRQRMDLHGLGSGRPLAEGLADTFGACPPQVSLLDAVVAMEGNGPTAGAPRPLGWIAASTDAVALDAVAGQLTGFGPREVPTTVAAAEAGYGCGELGEIAVLGEDPEALRVSIQRPARIPYYLPRWLAALGRPLLYVRPRVDERRCAGCGACAEVCPAQCLRIEEVARLDHRACLECFCCLEACPHEAIQVERSSFTRLLGMGRRKV